MHRYQRSYVRNSDAISRRKILKFQFRLQEFLGAFGFMHCDIYEFGVVINPKGGVLVRLGSRGTMSRENLSRDTRFHTIRTDTHAWSRMLTTDVSSVGFVGFSVHLPDLAGGAYWIGFVSQGWFTGKKASPYPRVDLIPVCVSTSFMHMPFS